MQNASGEEELLREIVGEQLSSVEFVQDYVQLRFNGPTLTAVTHPVVVLGNRKLYWNDPEFRNALCNRIAKKVVSVGTVLRHSVRIEFDDGAVIEVSLRDEDYVVPDEAVRFDDDLDPTKSWGL